MAERSGLPTPRGGRAGLGGSGTSEGRRSGWRDLPLGGYRLLISTSGGLLFIPAMVFRSEAVCAVAAAIVLASALLARDSLHRRSRGSALGPCLHGTMVAAMIGIFAWRVDWSIAASVGGAAALLFVLQLLAALNWRGTSDRERLDQLRRQVVDSPPDDGGLR